MALQIRFQNQESKLELILKISESNSAIDSFSDNNINVILIELNTIDIQ